MMIPCPALCSVILKKANMDAQGIRTNFLKTGGCGLGAGASRWACWLRAAWTQHPAATLHPAAACATTDRHQPASSNLSEFSQPVSMQARSIFAQKRCGWPLHCPPRAPWLAGTIARGAAETGAVEAYMCSRLMRHPLVSLPSAGKGGVLFLWIGCW